MRTILIFLFLLRVFKALVIVCIQHKRFSVLVEKYSMCKGRRREVMKKVFLICLEWDIDSSNSSLRYSKIYHNKKYYGYTFKIWCRQYSIKYHIFTMNCAYEAPLKNPYHIHSFFIFIFPLFNIFLIYFHSCDSV